MHPSLSGFAAYRQFVVYKVVPKPNGKSDKFPCDWRTGEVVSAHNPAVWTDAATAEATAAAWGSGYGVGFVFTENDPYWFLDIDSCLTNGVWSPLALQLFQYFQGCAVEISQSGTGAHIFGRGTPPPHGCKNIAQGLEFYHTGRFVALTGTAAIGSVDYETSGLLPGLVAQFFPDIPAVAGEGWTDGPCEEWNGPPDTEAGNADLLRRALQSQSGAALFGNKASFADLWFANEAVLALAYPDPERPYDASSADQALANHLSFWTGRDCERIRRLMEMSGLKRDKWEREDYLLRTIGFAVSRGSDVLQDKPPAVALSAPMLPPVPQGVAAQPLAPSAATARGGNGFLTCDEQHGYFTGCVYVRNLHRAFIPGGVLLKPEQFKVQFGGFQFHLDIANEKTTRDAWEAWTQSQAWQAPMVDGTCFKPDRAPGEVITVSGQTFINTYFPVAVSRSAGDPTPFLNHIAKVLPNERDAQILLSYMAACVQHQGVKFQWAPLLQGVEGNGKTLFARCVAEAIGRRYVHWPNASKLAEKFNGWMVGKTFFAVEDVYVPDARREVIEQLKPMITGGDGLEIEAKGMDQISADICGNFMFNSNHRDAIKKTTNDRRFCVLYSAQQQVADLARDGMHGDYFPNLYQWLRYGGYAIVSEFLWTYDISAQFNPATDCQRAPQTTSTSEAVTASAGNVEQEIEEAISQGLQGFAGGWISSVYLDKLLERLGLARKVSHHKRKELLEQMGYVYHPALKDGRVNNPVVPDGRKSRLFVQQSSMLIQITSAVEVARKYEEANKNADTFVNLPFAASR